jgi:hypothetical protein
MAIDDEIELQAYAALNKIGRILRPHERERIYKYIILTIMHRQGWTEVRTVNGEDDAKR